MFETSRCGRFFLVCVFVLCACAAVFGAGGDRIRLVSRDLLGRAGLEVVWDDKLPIHAAEKLTRLSIVGNQVRVLTNHNFLITLDKNKGSQISSGYVAPVGMPVGEPVLYDGELISVIGRRLIEVSERTGEELRSNEIPFGLACRPARNSSFFYIAGLDRRVHVLRVEDRVQLFEVGGENESMITSILADEDSVIFGTDGGNVVSMIPGRPRRLWRFDASGAIAGPIIRDGTSLFFASEDTNVYRLDVPGLQLRELIWRLQVPGIPEGPPRVAKTAVYQYIRGKGLTAIDKDRGRRLWLLPEGVELLAEAGSRAYVITKDRTLAVMDNAEGRKLYTVNFQRVNVYTANPVDSKMYIADQTGRIACLQPVE